MMEMFYYQDGGYKCTQLLKIGALSLRFVHLTVCKTCLKNQFSEAPEGERASTFPHCFFVSSKTFICV